MHAVIGHSEEVESSYAAQDAIEQIRQQANGQQPKAAMLFASVDYQHDAILAAIQSAWPGLPLIGGSGDGEMSSKLGFVHDSVLLTVLFGDDLEARVGCGLDLSQNPALAVTSATEDFASDRQPVACFTVFAPTADSSVVVDRLQGRVGSDCPVLGGLAGDHREFSRMREFCGDRVLSNSLPVLALYGKAAVSWGIGTGWFPIGRRHSVTASEGHVVHGIDGRPAIDVYREFWGNVPQQSIGEHLIAVFPDEASEDEYYLRAAMDYDEESGSIRFAGTVPEGTTISLTEVQPEGILSGTQNSVRQARANYRGSDPKLALAFSCAARKWVLGTKAEKESDLFREALIAGGGAADADAPSTAGIYCFGEIAPFPAAKGSRFHNETCVTVLLGE